MSPDHHHGHGAHDHEAHSHGVTADTDRRWLSLALALITVFIAVESVIAFISGSLALLSDAAHMLTDAASIVLALVAMRLSARPARGGYTFGLKRAEILSAQANGLSLLLLAAWLGYEAIHRIIDPPEIEGWMVLVTALVGIVVNLIATWCISKANRTSLNVEGAYQHILNDLFAFIGTAVAGLIMLTTGFARADGIATLLVVVLMIKAGYGLVRDSGRVLLQAAPDGLDPDAIGDRLASHDGVAEVHDLHVWAITSGHPTLSAHVIVEEGEDCHAVRGELDGLLVQNYGITHSTLQVDHAPELHDVLTAARPKATVSAHCPDPHGPAHFAEPHDH
ncbi:cation diffusion facilitator family transporter [Streptomyces oceani]|uniref:Cation diffusion facilitator family transporter n=1 Tax=Streptomyces oceani TaxID=1075402 RepID=A0A1E7KPA0_9ACTN|nr:cation diffusion facilitator family transporter [Streptomyces oceani]OEV05737.1 cation diffusion facilitator family transporter [Streptomyces oceani]